jgi:Ca-activated chloride channel family protein
MSNTVGNHYAFLGVPRDATKEEIRGAYHEGARRFHPDTNKSPEATEQFLRIQKAFDVLGNEAARNEYDLTLPAEPEDRKITLTPLLSRNALLPTSEPQLVYLLLEIAVDPGERRKSAPPLNVCILIDRSTSMRGDRIEIVKATARKIVSQLRPQDFVSIVEFSDRARVVVPPNRGVDLRKIEAQISQIQVGGGTEIYQGLRLAYREVARHTRASHINHIILITDGHTYGDEENCLALAEEARAAGITISGLGIGKHWNDDFMDRLTSRTGGNSIYIAFAKDIKRFMELKFSGLNNIVAENLTLVGQGNKNGVSMRYVFRIHPDPTRLENGQKLPVGNAALNEPVRVVIEFLIERVDPDAREFNLFNGSLWLEFPDRAIPVQRRYLDLTLPVSSDATTHPPPPEIVQAMSRLTLYRMQEQARRDMSEGDFDGATRRLKNLATQLLAKGEPQLASMILKEASLVESGTRDLASLDKAVKYGTRALLLPPGTNSL